MVTKLKTGSTLWKAQRGWACSLIELNKVRWNLQCASALSEELLLNKDGRIAACLVEMKFVKSGNLWAPDKSRIGWHSTIGRIPTMMVPGFHCQNHNKARCGCAHLWVQHLGTGRRIRSFQVIAYPEEVMHSHSAICSPAKPVLTNHSYSTSPEEIASSVF